MGLKKLLFIVLTTGIIHTGYSQSETDTETNKKERKGSPDIPGTFLIDFGLSFTTDNPVGFNTGLWGSRTLNLYYIHDKQFGQSKFSIHPGIGFGLERYKFNNEKTLAYIPGPDSPFDTLRMVDGVEGITKSQLIANYIDALVELRFSSSPNDPAHSFKASIGIKGGYLFDSFTKQKYRENRETKKLKDKQNWNVTEFRYGLTARMAYGNFGLFGYYSLTPIFLEGKGPDMADLNSWTIGITLSGF